MNATEAREALLVVRSSPYLAGHAPRFVSGWALFVGLLAVFSALPVVTLYGLGYSPTLGLLPGFALLFFAWRSVQKRAASMGAANDAGVVLTRSGKSAEAIGVFALPLRGVVSRSVGAALTTNIAWSALRIGDTRHAAAFARVSASLSGPRPTVASAWSWVVLANALVADGKLDEADEVLREIEPVALERTRAGALRARIVLHCRRGQYDEALALLDRERLFLMRASAGAELALLDAAERYAKRQKGGVFRETAHATPVGHFGYGDEAAAYLKLMLPEAATITAGA